MHVMLQPSPSVSHKYRVILPHSQIIDFGKRTMRYYPDHGNPSLMRAHLIRKGAIVPDKVRLETDPSKIHREMLTIQESSLENWDDKSVSEYWERWILWSYPSIREATLYMTLTQDVLFTENLNYQ